MDVLEDDILNVSEDDADALKEQAQEVPLQLWTLTTFSRALSSIQRETQMYLDNSIIIIIIINYQLHTITEPH